MKKFRTIDCLSMAYGLSFMAVIILSINGCWNTLAMMAAVMVCVWLAIVQRGQDKSDKEEGGQNG